MNFCNKTVQKHKLNAKIQVNEQFLYDFVLIFAGIIDIIVHIERQKKGRLF